MARSNNTWAQDMSKKDTNAVVVVWEGDFGEGSGVGGKYSSPLTATLETLALVVPGATTMVGTFVPGSPYSLMPDLSVRFGAAGPRAPVGCA